MFNIKATVTLIVLSALYATISAPAQTTSPPAISTHHIDRFEAIHILQHSLKANPNDTKLLIQVGNIYEKTHQFKPAAEYYEKALKVDPKNVEIRNEMASCLYYSGDVDGALSQLQQSLKADPKNVNALFNLGMVLWKGKNDTDGAVAAWQQLLKSNPGLDRKPVVEKMIAEAKTQRSTAN